MKVVDVIEEGIGFDCFIQVFEVQAKIACEECFDSVDISKQVQAGNGLRAKRRDDQLNRDRLDENSAEADYAVYHEFQLELYEPTCFRDRFSFLDVLLREECLLHGVFAVEKEQRRLNHCFQVGRLNRGE